MLKKNGLNDSDKILVTVALWITALSAFLTALTLPMLPAKVAIFYRPADDAIGEYYSKYNNLLLILTSVIPAAIIIITALLKRRHRLQNNFISIMLFSIMLSLCMSGVIAYGISEQFDASSSVNTVNQHALIVMCMAFVLSIGCALTPMIIHTPVLGDSLANDVRFKWKLARAADWLWNVGAYGFLITAVVCVFVPDAYCYVPIAAWFIAYITTLLVIANGTHGKPQPVTE